MQLANKVQDPPNKVVGEVDINNFQYLLILCLCNFNKDFRPPIFVKEIVFSYECVVQSHILYVFVIFLIKICHIEFAFQFIHQAPPFIE